MLLKVQRRAQIHIQKRSQTPLLEHRRTLGEAQTMMFAVRGT